MYELTDSNFFIMDPSLLAISGVVIVLAIAGIFFLRAKKSNRSE